MAWSKLTGMMNLGWMKEACMLMMPHFLPFVRANGFIESEQTPGQKVSANMTCCVKDFLLACEHVSVNEQGN